MSIDNFSNMKLKDVGEFGLIDRLSEIMKGTLAPGVIGAGDDCAVIPLAPNCSTAIVITTDAMIEGRHFRWEYTSAFDLGWKLLAVNLSDIAAAGGKPVAAVMTLQLRPELETAIVEEIYRGAAALAKKHGVSLAGGDTTSSSVTALGATVFGLTERAVVRSGAHPGDDLWVSGPIGLGGLGFAVARGAIAPAEIADNGTAARERYCRPEPRVALGQRLSEQGIATAAIDISDGLIQDAGHIANRSGVGVRVDLDRLPRGPESRQWPALHAATCGDDYELLFSAKPEHRSELEADPSLVRIGSIVGGGESSGVVLKQPDGSYQSAEKLLEAAGLPAGFVHFG